MRLRKKTSLRTKIVALLVSLVALWAFAAWVTLREGVNLLWVSVLNTNVAQPIVDLQPELQHERQLSLIRLGAPGPQQIAALQTQRARTDKAVAAFRKLARSGSVKAAQSGTLKHAIDIGLGQLANLNSVRAQVDSGKVGLNAAAAPYSTAIENLFEVDEALASLDDKDFAKDVRASLQLNRATEIFSQEDSLMSGILASRRFPGNEYLDFIQIVGAQRYNMEKAVQTIKGSDDTTYDLLTKSPALVRFNAAERTVVARSRPNKVPPITGRQWRAVADPAIKQLSQAVFGYGDRLVKRATPIAIGVIVRLFLAGGLGLLAVIASVIVSISTARALMRQLERLRDAARELADRRLPGVVERLGHGEKVDVAAEVPPLAFGDDEVGQVGQAFNTAAETAIRTAVEQAELRRGIRDILLSLARRSQALVHRQLTLLDGMERRQDDSAELEDLFRVDHLATRMRRNAENLIVLSGATPARGWRLPVPMFDVVRSAVAEVEDYTRVSVRPMGEFALAGRAVGDIVHLLAELIENAVSFSPPYTQAQVSGHRVAKGYVIEIEDRGLGMTDEILESINERIRDTPEFNLSSSAHLGLFVVGKLAERYDVHVSLKHSSYGGTTAVVLLPNDLIVELEAEEEPAEHRPLPVAVGAAGLAAASYKDVPARIAPTDSPELPELPEPLDGPKPPLPTRTSTNAETPVPTDSSETTTPSGLPVRVPQASIAPALRTDKPADGCADEQRAPEEIRRVVGGLQAATRRGRSDAAATSPDLPVDDEA
jgi:signal transduction histidine kinase